MDDNFKFLAPNFYDFENGETEDEIDYFFEYYREGETPYMRRAWSSGNLYENNINVVETLNQLSIVNESNENCSNNSSQVSEDSEKSKNPKRTLTVAHSPKLATKNRTRQTHVLSQKMREDLEIQEMKKYKFKAQKLNEKMLKEKSVPANVQKKPMTRPKPFNLTEIKQKNLSKSLENIPKFTAKPVPSKNIRPVNNKPKPVVTEPKTPCVLKRSILRKQLEANEKKEETKQASNNIPKSPTASVKIFERYEIIKKKHEERIRRIMEEEKKMREFHAKPVPKFIRQKSLTHSLISNESNDENHQKENNCQFKARPPVVLYKEPFIPKKADRPFTEIQEFHLHSNARAKEREEFEKKLKQKEKNLEKLKQQKLKAEELHLEEERKRLREEATFKASGIRKFHEFQIKPSDQSLTSPKSPALSSRFKK